MIYVPLCLRSTFTAAGNRKARHFPTFWQKKKSLPTAQTPSVRKRSVGVPNEKPIGQSVKHGKIITPF